jgi:acetyltransferase-like isoleucine patch superfamily enzyme
MSEPLYLSHDWYPLEIPRNVEIGEGSWLYSSFTFIHFQSEKELAVRIGKSSGIYNGSFFDLGPQGEVEIGNYSTLVGAIICSNKKILIGDYVFIAHEVVIADGYVAAPLHFESPKMIDSSATAESPVIEIGENVWIGARSVILGGARIGQGAVIGAGTVVDFEVPPYAVVAGSPARIVAVHPPEK